MHLCEFTLQRNVFCRMKVLANGEGSWYYNKLAEIPWYIDNENKNKDAVQV